MLDENLIVVVDDDASLCDAIVGLVRSYGYEAKGFESAINYMDSPDFASTLCLVTDINMPGVSGLDLARHMRSVGNLAPIIMITAREDSDLEERSRAMGAACFLRKPFEADQLMECIADCVGDAAA
ncbi:response regulator transcription factor [Sphingomonas oleivorans]|uniref:response regulator transcription factor n=1 Tax=Sphingomonas oleivorans TaxID=1735121 RepID=UPI0013FDD075|nr:response regulator [Sphingomonas oleivorans]